MRTKKIYDKIGEYYMYAVIAMWFGGEILLNTTLKQILFWQRELVNERMAVITLVMLVIQIALFQRYTIREFFVVLFLSLPIVAGTLNSGNNIMMSMWLFVIASKNINLDKVFRLAYYLLLILVPFVVYMYFTGAIDEVVMYRGSVVRHSYGFSHPNWLGVRVSQIVLLRTYLRRKRIGILDYLFIIVGVVFTYCIPNNQTAYVILMMLLIFAITEKLICIFVDGQKAFSMVLIVGAILANVLTVTLSLIDVERFAMLSKFDQLLSHRFSWCHRTYMYYKISPFGQAINLYISKIGGGITRLYLDSAYMAILLRYGFVTYICISLLYIFAMIYCYKRENYMLVMILSIYAIYGIMANTFYSLTQNIFLLAISSALYTKELKKDEYKVPKYSTRIRITV